MIDTAAYDDLKADPNIKVVPADAGNLQITVFNHQWGIFAESRKARQALQAISVPAETMAAATHPSLSSLCPSIWYCPGSPLYTEEGSELTYKDAPNLELGQRLWAEAVQETGHTGPITIITQTGYQRFYGASQVIAANLQDRLGAEVDFQVTDWPTIWNRQKDPDDRWHITFTGWGFVHSGNPFTSGFMDSSWLVGYDREDNDVTRELYALRDQFATAGSLAEKQDLAARI